MIEFTFLGNSGGIQSKMGGNTSLLISNNETLVLIDTSGSPIKAIEDSGFDSESLDVVLLTHKHIDHIYALPSLIHNLWLKKRTRALDIYGNEQVIDFACELINLFGLPQKANMFEIVFHKIVENQELQLKGLYAKPFVVNHGVSTFGFVFTDRKQNKVVYTSDCNASTTLPSFAQDCDVLIHEVAMQSNKDHTGPEDLIEQTKLIRAKKLMLVHLPPKKEQREEILKTCKEGFSNTQIPVLNHKYVVG